MREKRKKKSEKDDDIWGELDNIWNFYFASSQWILCKFINSINSHRGL
jgi:hypothetical protein